MHEEYACTCSCVCGGWWWEPEPSGAGLLAQPSTGELLCSSAVPGVWSFLRVTHMETPVPLGVWSMLKHEILLFSADCTWQVCSEVTSRYIVICLKYQQSRFSHLSHEIRDTTLIVSLDGFAYAILVTNVTNSANNSAGGRALWHWTCAWFL